MLYAKFTPSLSYNKSNDPFNPQTVGLNYMKVVAPGYSLGATSADFNVYFGTGTLTDNKVVAFEPLVVKIITVGGTALSNWGTTDVPLLEYIAGTFDLTVTNTYPNG